MFCTDRGRALRTHNEEITRWRWARKRFDLPAAAVGHAGELWLYLRPYARHNGVPLEVRVNGKRAAMVSPDPLYPLAWGWYRVGLPRITKRRLEVELRADTPAMNAWMLGLDPTLPPKFSALSLDQGAKWRNDSMGAHQALRGEYMVRLRSHNSALSELTPPPIRYDDPKHPHLRELAKSLPPAIRRLRDPWRQMRALRTWVATRWLHDPFGQAYAPWDPATIMDWSMRAEAHGQRGKVAMCVHYAVVMAGCAAALGHKSRCIVITREMNSEDGHFVCEVFDKKRGKWILHDPNYDVHYEDGEPLSGVELADRAIAGLPFESWVVQGRGMPTKPGRVLVGFRSLFATGRSYRQMAVWLRNDLISDPAAGPPNHGSITYCETDLLWYNPEPQNIAPMFPYRTGKSSKLIAAPR